MLLSILYQLVRWLLVYCTDPKLRCRSATCGLAIRSGRSVVFVDHTAKYPVASDQAVEGQGGWLVLLAGGALAESLMRPVRIVVPGVLGQDPGGVAFGVDQDTVGALTADGAHEPLGITVRPRSSRRRLDDRDVLAPEHGVEAGGELGVSVPDEEAERADPIAQIHGQVASGLSDPLPPRMCSRPQDMHPASAHLDHEQYIKPAQEDRVKVEEIAGQQALGLTAQKRPPRGVRLPGSWTIPLGTQDRRTVDSPSW
jgi:hypothetical protein